MGNHRQCQSAVRKLAEFTEAANYQPDLVLIIGTGSGSEVEVMKEHWANAKYLGYDALEYFVERAGKFLETHHGAVVMTDNKPDIVFFRRRGNPMASSLWPRKEGRNLELTVPAISLDKIREKHELEDMRTILWIDCEGAELSAMRGGPEMMKQIDFINIELTPEGMGREGWPDSKRVHRWLWDNGFERIHIHRGRSEDVPHDSIYVRRGLSETSPISEKLRNV